MNEEERNKDDRNDEIVVLSESEPKERLSACLVGKLWTDKSSNVKTFIKTIREIWFPKKGVDINELGKNLFLFQFSYPKRISKRLWTTNLDI